MARLTNTQKQDFAKVLYTRERLTQKEVAERVGVSPQTMTRWVKQEKWDEERNGYSVTREQQLKETYRQMTELNEVIAQRPKGERFPTSKEADSLLKLAQTAKQLETDASLDEIINAFSEYLDWLRGINLEEAKSTSVRQDQFIKYKLSRQ